MTAELPRLTRALAATPGFRAGDSAETPRPELLPERAVQFGTGALLRGLVDDVIDAANRRGCFGGSIVAIGSTGSGRDGSLNAQDGLFTLIEQGLEGGLPVERVRIVTSVSRALSATTEWDAVLRLARDPAIQIAFSNTTEVGIVYDESDASSRPPVPASYPGKLAAFLEARGTAFEYSAASGLVVIPCELIEDNGTRLRDIVLRLARAWGVDARLIHWIERHVIFANTLVDRIVTGTPIAPDSARLEDSLGYRDSMITICEPYHLLAMEGGTELRALLPFAASGRDTGAVIVDDVRPFRERKVRILNGAHTAMVSAALIAGFRTVGEAVLDERFGTFVRRMIFDEIVPTVDAPDAEGFAHQVLARFANPTLRHALADITLHGTTKMRVRVVPSILELPRRTGKAAQALALGFAAHLMLHSPQTRERLAAAGVKLSRDDQGAAISARWTNLPDQSDAALARLARDVCGDRDLWGADLREHGFADIVTTHLSGIVRRGVFAVLDLGLGLPLQSRSTPAKIPA